MYDKYLSNYGSLGRSKGISVTLTKERTVSENQRGMPLPSFQRSWSSYRVNDKKIFLKNYYLEVSNIYVKH